jgi:hypothetical protein
MFVFLDGSVAPVRAAADLEVLHRQAKRNDGLVTPNP